MSLSEFASSFLAALLASGIVAVVLEARFNRDLETHRARLQERLAVRGRYTAKRQAAAARIYGLLSKGTGGIAFATIDGDRSLMVSASESFQDIGKTLVSHAAYLDERISTDLWAVTMVFMGLLDRIEMPGDEDRAHIARALTRFIREDPIVRSVAVRLRDLAGDDAPTEDITAEEAEAALLRVTRTVEGYLAEDELENPPKLREVREPEELLEQRVPSDLEEKSTKRRADQ